MSFQKRRSINRRKVPLIRELCEDLGFHQGAGANKTKNPMTESTHGWRRSYVTPKGTPGKDLIDWPDCIDDLFEMTRAYLESGHGEVHWPANGYASPRTVPEYPKDLNEIVEGLVNLFWLQNKIEANNRKRYSHNPRNEDSDSSNRDSADQEQVSQAPIRTKLTMEPCVHRPETTQNPQPAQRNETSNQWAAVNEGLPTDYEQGWNAIIHHRPTPLADPKTSSESEEDDSEDSDYGESKQLRPTTRRRDLSAAPDEVDSELSRNKPSKVLKLNFTQFESIQKPARDTHKSIAFKTTRKSGDTVSPPVKRRRVETQESEDDSSDEEHRHHAPRRTSKRARVDSAISDVSSNDSEPSRDRLPSKESEVDDKDDKSWIVNSGEHPTPGSSRISPTIMRPPNSAENHEQGLGLSGQSSDDSKPTSRGESLILLLSQAKKSLAKRPQAAPGSNPAAPQLPIEQSNIPPMASDRQVNREQNRSFSDQVASINARVAQPRIRFMIITHAPLAERYWRKGTFKDRSLEDIFAGVSDCIRRPNIQEIVFKLKTKSHGESTYPIDRDDHAGFEDMKERFVNNITEDAKKGDTNFEIKLELEPDRVEETSQEAAEEFQCDFRGFF